MCKSFNIEITTTKQLTHLKPIHDIQTKENKKNKSSPNKTLLYLCSGGGRSVLICDL